jgi:uncharacterized RDD family membrane protein YckC
MTTPAPDLEYVGFWLRLGASLIDSVLLAMVCWPVLTYIYGWGYWSSDKLIHGPADFLVSWLLPAIAVVIFWINRQATPGKIAIRARIVDADTGDAPSTGKLVIRYLGYYVSTIALFMGFIWIAFDPRKQGWHDKMANTVVVRSTHRGPEPVRFPNAPAP